MSTVESRWAKLGALFSCRPARSTPDIERLLLDTTRAITGNARLLPMTVTWLVAYENFVARQRLRHLARAAALEERATLGLLIDFAIAQGASEDLRLCSRDCEPLRSPGPLFEIHRRSDALLRLAESSTHDIARRWGLWTPLPELKHDAIRPVEWILEHNPTLRERVVRKGDLRCSILETLRNDTDGESPSESELARQTGATRAAVRASLHALQQEGAVRIAPRPDGRGSRVITLAA